MFERNTVDRPEDHFRLYHRSIRGTLSLEDQMVRLKNSEGKVSDSDEGICEHLNTKFQSRGTIYDSELGRDGTLGSTDVEESGRKKTLDLEPYKVNERNGI